MVCRECATSTLHLHCNTHLIDLAANARGNRAAQQIDAAIERLGDLPRRILADHREKGLDKRIIARCERIERGEPLIDEDPVDRSPAAARRARRLSEDQRIAARVQRMLNIGSVSRAARALEEAPLANTRDPAVRPSSAARQAP